MRPKNAAVLKMRCGSLCSVFELKVAAVQKNGCGLLAKQQCDECVQGTLHSALTCAGFMETVWN